MDFSLSPDQQAILDSVAALCADFDLDYWRRRDAEGGFPQDFHAAIASAGYLGVAMPTEYGGSGLGMTEAVLVLQAISRSGAGLSGASSVHMNIFGLHPVVVFGTSEQKARWLPPLIRGEQKACFGVTEPNTGLNTQAGFHACETAVMTHGGMGYAKEYHVERFLHESLIPRIAPVSRELIMSFIAEKVFGLPKSY
ncbi:MAG TPA: acyl-CoA dehydrogenase family protein [Steroidobacteraceae bacterium]|jgi:alkylation response protein AidB-like acyl-CoA dehydrogenase